MQEETEAISLKFDVSQSIEYYVYQTHLKYLYFEQGSIKSQKEENKTNYVSILGRN